MNKRRILVAALAVALIAILACGSLAYFTSTKTLTNKFMTATYDPSNPDKPVTGEELFSIKVYETDNTKTDNSVTETGNTYANILPGDVLKKDPTVQNTGDYSAYVRVAITMTKAAEWETVCAKHNLTDWTDLLQNFNSAWELKETSEDVAANTVTKVYYLNTALDADVTSQIFDGINIPDEFDVDDMAALAAFDITITADAIQTKNTGNNAFDAFDNFWE